MDTPPDTSFDQLARLAKFTCDATFSAVSFIDGRRQWFKSQHGLEVAELPVGDSFCAHALMNPGEVMVVEDTLNDPRFAENPLVVGEKGIRFYAGIPIVTAEGEAIGAVCVYDTRPRVLRFDQSEGLRCLADWASDFLEKRLPELTSQRCPACGGPKHHTGSSLS